MALTGSTGPRASLWADYIREYVTDHVHIGGTIKMPKDLYNAERGRSSMLTSRIVDAFYEHFVLTHDEYERHETFGYFDVYTYLRGEESDG